MKVITVARKPVAGSVAQNALKHGTGGINIDGCRISFEDTQDPATNPLFRKNAGYRIACGNDTDSSVFKLKRSGPQDMNVNVLGRWPANLILQHLPGCRCIGTREIPGYTINRWDDGMKPFGEGSGHPYSGEKQPPQEIEVWECQPGCPIADMDEQSGVSHGTGGKSSGGSAFGQNLGWNAHNNRSARIVRMNDAGGASRYFKQVQTKPEG